MALNPPVLADRTPAPVTGEYMVLVRKDIEAEISLENKTKYKGKGKLFLTTVRMVFVNEKNNELILQIQTGCEGLNLQENYSEIYFVSPHWNPAVEDQAIARCHRIGQKNTVSVFKFQMSSFISEEIDENGLKIDTLTIDKYVNTVQDSKREMANELISN